MSGGDYCDELAHSRLSTMVRGDTPSSSRLYDAIDLGVLSVTIAPRMRWRDKAREENASLLETMSPAVWWREFLLDATDTTVDGIARRMQSHLAPFADTAAWCSLERKRMAMLRALPMISWSRDPYTTAMGVLAQAAMEIDRHVDTR